MRFDLHKKNILNDVRTQYPNYLFKSRWDEQDYLGCGSCDYRTHVYLTLVCTIPIFKNLADAKEQLLEHFGWERKFENCRLKNQIETPGKAIHFLANYKKTSGWSGPQAFIFRPEQLEKICETLKDIFPKSNTAKSNQEIIKDIFQNSLSTTRGQLLHLTKQHLYSERDLIVSANWRKAIDNLKHCALLKFIKLFWENVKIKDDTRRLVKELDALEGLYFGPILGTRNCGTDMIAVVCQLDDEKGKK